jgi:hypothetical protein
MVPGERFPTTYCSMVRKKTGTKIGAVGARRPKGFDRQVVVVSEFVNASSRHPWETFAAGAERDQAKGSPVSDLN